MNKTLLSGLSAAALLLPSATAFSAEAMEQADTAVPAVVTSTRYESDPHLTRAEFTSLLVQSLIPGTANLGCFDRLDANPIPPATFFLVFSDVRTNDPYAMDLCAALRAGYVKGYSDGAFRPDEKMNNASAAKMLSIAFALPALTHEDTAWYMPYMNAVNQAGVTLGDSNSGMSMSDAESVIATLKAHTGFEELKDDWEEISDTEDTSHEEDMTEEEVEETQEEMTDNTEESTEEEVLDETSDSTEDTSSDTDTSSEV